MKKTVCDRCGAETTEYAFQAQQMPYVKATIYDFFPRGTVEIDLCRACQTDFIKWVRKGQKKESENDDERKQDA